MGDGDDGALVLLEVLLEPEHALGVEVVGGLVQQQQVGLLQQQLAQRHATALAAGEVGDGLVAGRAAQRVHRLLELRVEVPAVLGVDLGLELAHLLHQRVEVRVGLGHLLADGVEALDLLEQLAHALLDVLQDGLGLVQRRLLQQDADAVAGAEARLAVGGLVQPRHDLQDRRLAGAVGADHADLRARVEAHGDVIEDDLVAHGLAGLVHRVDELCQCGVLVGRWSVCGGLTGAPHCGAARESSRCPTLPRPSAPRPRGREHLPAGPREGRGQSIGTPRSASTRRAIAAPCSAPSGFGSPLRGQ